MSFDVHADSTRVLPAFSKPYPDELLSSWLTRMAYHHGRSTTDFCKIIWEKYLFNPDIDLNIKDEDLLCLVERTMLTFDEVKATTLKFYEQELGRNLIIPPRYRLQNKSRQSQHYWKEFYGSGLMFCPGCLNKLNYFRKEWRLAISFVCLECGCYLRDRCPHCGNGNSFMGRDSGGFMNTPLSRFLSDCHVCAKDVTVGNGEVADKSMIYVQRNLYKQLESCEKQRPFYFNVLYYLSCFIMINEKKSKKVNDFAKDVITSNGFSVGEVKKYQGESRRLPVRERAGLFFMAHWLLEKWPYRLVDLCRKHGFTCADILPEAAWVPEWFRASIARYLAYIPSDQVMARRRIREKCSWEPEWVKRPPKMNYDYDFDFDAYYYDNEDEDCEIIMEEAFLGIGTE